MPRQSPIFENSEESNYTAFSLNSTPMETSLAAASSIPAVQSVCNDYPRNSFIRKPVPAPQLEPYELLSTNNTNHIRRRPSSHQQVYDPIEQKGVAVTGSDRPTEPLEIEQAYHDSNDDMTTTTLERHLSLFDLITVGVGGTIGSGLFVLSGLVAHSYAGPSTVLSWAISGSAACLSGCCYAELAARIPLSGGTYAYTYVAMGELPAVLTAACLTLEYVASASAVSRSWGDKCVEWMIQEFGEQHWIQTIFGTRGTFNPLALLISCSVVALLLNGVKESKQATNFFTCLKLGVVLLMVSVGMFHIQPSNWTPFIPPEYGVAGMVRGATGTFFGYIGFDQVSCIAGEAMHPKRDLPVAIMVILVIVSTIYMFATLVLTGMQPYQDISPVSGFPVALYSVGANIAGHLVAFGEVFTLPIVILIGTLAQPRLQFALAEDGLLPAFFRKLDSRGNLWNGTLFAGCIMIIVATFVPFQHLNDVISCAVLSALSMTNTSLILLWHEPPDPESMLGIHLLLVFHFEALVTAIAVARYLDSVTGCVVAVLGVLCMILTSCAVAKWCPRSTVFGGRREHHRQDAVKLDDGYFYTPFVPYLPCAGIFVNWSLIAQLDLTGVAGLLFFMILAILYYFLYARHHSVCNNTKLQSDQLQRPQLVSHAKIKDMDQSACTNLPPSYLPSTSMPRLNERPCHNVTLPVIS